MYADIVKAEVHMFNVFTHIFARCTIEPCVDREGCPVPLDLEKFLPQPEMVTVTAHPPYQVRFVPRAEKRIR